MALAGQVMTPPQRRPLPEWEREFLAELEKYGVDTAQEPAVPCPLCTSSDREPVNLANCMALTISFAVRPVPISVEALFEAALAAMRDTGLHVEYSTARGLRPYKPGMFPEWGMMLWESHDNHEHPEAGS